MIKIILSLLAFIFSVTFHEFCHAYTAYLLGDDTAKQMGRLTLNPLAHIDPLGILFLIFLRIGWAKPVPFDPNNFRYPKFYAVLVGLAGPVSNIVLAILSLYGLKYLSGELVLMVCKNMAWINVMLALFNLLPIPPLDGSHLLAVFIPREWYRVMAQYSIIALIVLMFIPGFQQAFFRAIKGTVLLLSRLVI